MELMDRIINLYMPMALLVWIILYLGHALWKERRK